jgi:hypothetical protein
VDLRALMRRLWPEEPARPAAAPEPTAVRPAATAGGDVAGRDAPGGRPEREPSRTILAPRLARRRWRLALAALSVAAVAVALLLGRGAGRTAAGTAGVATDAARASGQGAAPASPPPADAPPGPELQPLEGDDGAAEAAGTGLVRVVVTPWATVSADGTRVGETPRDLRLGAGPHRLRAEHPTMGAAELELTVQPGRRLLWRPALKK